MVETAFKTHALLPCQDPAAMADGFCQQVQQDHGLTFLETGNGQRAVESAGFRISLAPLRTAVRFDMEGPDRAMLVFFKDAIAEALTKIAPARALDLRWSGEDARAGALPPNFRLLTVTRVRDVMPKLKRVTCAVTDQRVFDAMRQHLNLMLPRQHSDRPIWPVMGPHGAPLWPDGAQALHKRTVSIRYFRADLSEIDLDILCHGDGLISDWATQARPGDEIGAMGPAGHVIRPESERLFLAGDLTALSSIARLLEAGGQDLPGKLIIGGATSDDLRAYMPDNRLDLMAGPMEDLAERISAAAQEETRMNLQPFGFFAGEKTLARKVKRLFLEDLRLLNTGLSVSTYWVQTPARMG